MNNTELKSKVVTLANQLTSRMGGDKSAAFVRAWAICKAGGLELAVRGVSFGNRQEALKRLAAYAPDQVRAVLVPEPENMDNIESVSTIMLDRNNLTMDVGETKNLIATVILSNDNTMINWTSSDETIVTVDNNGKITAHAIGDAVVCATSDGINHAEYYIVVNSIYVLSTGGYWKDGVWVELIANNGNIFGLTVSEGKVYASGYYGIASPSDPYYDYSIYRKACYWADGQRIDLPVETGNYYASDIFVINNTVYVAGCYGKFNAAGIIIDEAGCAKTGQR